MINNRQAGRRRGRGGQRPQGGAPNGQGSGNRIDSRARGNANQLYEKYKTLARDAQMQGDRVNIEYYLQFADHYFRVLSESRPRPDEQQQRRGNDAFDDEDGDFDGDDDIFDQQPRYEQQVRSDQQPRHEQQPRQDHRPRQERHDQQPRREREARDPAVNGDGAQGTRRIEDAPRPVVESPIAQTDQRTQRGAAIDEEPRIRRPRMRREPPTANGIDSDPGEAGQVTLDAAVLPPAISPVSGVEGEIDPAMPGEGKPRRRRRLAVPADEGVVN